MKTSSFCLGNERFEGIFKSGTGNSKGGISQLLRNKKEFTSGNCTKGNSV